MKTIEVKLFKLDELGEEAKKNAITKSRESDNWFDYDWFDCIYELWAEKLKQQGIDVKKIYFSGFCSQGDGACFDADVDIIKFIKSRGLGCKCQVLLEALETDSEHYYRIRHDGRYYHENCIDVNSEVLFYDGVQSWLKDAAEYFFYQDEKFWDKNRVKRAGFEAEIRRICIDYMKQIYNDLSNTWDCLNEDESIADQIRMNDVDFTEEGDIW